MSTMTNIIHYLSIILPFSNEMAIVFTESGYPRFKNLYKSCFDSSLLGNHESKLKRLLRDKLCTKRDYIHKILIDLLAYLGIMLLIGKNTLQYGYATGVVSGIVIIFYSIILPNMFLGFTTHKIIELLHFKTPFGHIIVGISLITLLIYITQVTESFVQKYTKNIKFDPEVEKNTKT